MKSKKLYIFLSVFMCLPIVLTACGNSGGEPSGTNASDISTYIAGTSDATTSAAAPTSSSVEPTGDVTQNAGIDVLGLLSYSGAYLEDGSDDAVENIAALRIRNDSGRAYQTLTLKVTSNGTVYEFFVTALLPGKEITVLERNRAEFGGDQEIYSCEISESSYFTEEPSMHADMFTIQTFSGVINLRNDSPSDIANDVFVYYKSKDSSGLLGGITYRVNFGALKSGELAQRASGHFDPENSEILFVTYG